MSRLPIAFVLFAVAASTEGADRPKKPRVVVTVGVEKEDPKFHAVTSFPPRLDPAELFSEAGAGKIRMALRAIARDKHARVVIETRTALTAAEQRECDKIGREKFFASVVAEKRGVSRTIDVYIILCAKPAFLHVQYGANMARKRLGAEDRRTLADKLAARLGEGRAEAGVLEALAFVSKKLPTIPEDDSFKEGTPLTAEEARWLKEMMHAEKSPEKKKALEAAFRNETRGNRKFDYDLFLAIKRDKGGE